MRPTPIRDARCEEILALIDQRPDGIERAELVAKWGVSVKCANAPFNLLKRYGIIDLTTPKGGKPRWARAENIEELRTRIAAERAIQAKLSKVERNRRRESRALAETGFRRAHCSDAPDMPVVQRIVPVNLGSKIDIDPSKVARSVWEWRGQTLRRRASEIAP